MTKEQKEMRKFVEKDAGGITLIALVVTIIVLIILAGITISRTVGDNGIFTKAKEAKKMQVIAEAKEKIGVEILDAQVEAIERNEELEQAQVEDIISKYGTLQDDKDTIILNDNGYEISLLDIYQGTTTSSGSYTENKAKIELLEGQVKRLQEQLDSMSQTGDEKDKTIAELNDKVTTIENEKNELQNENNSLTSKATELTNLKETLSKVTATEGQILKDYTAYKDGKLITGTMVNYAGNTVIASSITENGDNAEITIPSAGYYGTDSKISVPVETINSNLNRENIIDINSTSWNYTVPNNCTSIALRIQGWSDGSFYNGGILINKKNYDFSKDFKELNSSLVLNKDANYTYDASSRKLTVSSPFRILYAIIH